MEKKTMINKVELKGYLGKDPDVRSLSNGNKVARLTLATNEEYVDRSGTMKQNTSWHNVVAWNKLAEAAASMHKGMCVLLTGKLATRNYTDKQGNRHFLTEVVASEINPV